MKLTELEPEFLAREGECFRRSEVLPGADGIMFLCPTCFAANHGNVGTHRVICWRPHVPQSVSPGPGRWEFQGTSAADLTLVAGSSSVKILGGCNAHFFITNGEIIPS